MGVSRRLFDLLPAENALLYRLCKRYVDRYRGDNNTDIETNGELRFLTSIVPRAGTIVDVGANVGEWARLVLDLNPAVRLHCFEPSLPTYERLVANQFPPTVVCNNTGLGSSVGAARLLVFGERSGLNSLYRREGVAALSSVEDVREEIVQIETFDGYIERHGITGRVDLCKIDVEGHELEVLRGMTGALRRQQVQAIQFEYGGCNLDSGVLLKDVFDLLQPAGYEMHKIHPGGLRRWAEYDRSLETFQYQNWVALLTRG